MDINSFENRHIGANQDDIKKMLNTIGLGSVDELIHQTIPNSILKNSGYFFSKVEMIIS